MNWFISKIKSSLSSEIESNITFDNGPSRKYQIYINGYVIPRLSIQHRFQNHSMVELVIQLLEQYGFDFIHYVKGMFTIIVSVDKQLIIYNDRHSLQKFFTYQDGTNFFISNSLKLVSEKFSLTPSNENIAIYCLLEHFVDGMTLFKEVTYSKPATKLIIDEKGILTFENYYLPTQLLNREIKDYSFAEIAQNWRDMIKGYLDFLKPEEVTMTLTGGNDSRMVLAGLLANGIKPNAFTFGNPKSADAVIAKQIADLIVLNYNNYFVNNPTKEWFTEYSNKIIEIGNSLVNIHRAHRLDAIEKEIYTNTNDEMLLGGFMGGDYTKGIIYDDYITAKLMRLWKYDNRIEYDKINEILSQNFVDQSSVDIVNLVKKIKTLPYFDKKLSDLEREFLYVFYVVGCTHDWQDTYLFDQKIKYVVNPFMDIDFLEFLFSSKYSMKTKNNPDDNFLKKLNYPALAVNISHILAPELSDIPYAKKGFYSNKEYLGSKVVYFIKRLKRFNKKKNFPQNFPYNLWMSEFVSENLDIYESELKKLIFNSEKLREHFERSTYKTTEGFWHQYTNSINIALNLKKYGD